MLLLPSDTPVVAGQIVVDLRGSAGGVNTDEVVNVSNVPGATASDALNSLGNDVTAAQATADQATADAAAAQGTANAAQADATQALSDAATGIADAATAQVTAEAAASTATWGGITGTLATQVDLQAALDLKAPLASPALTGNPTAPTATPGDNDTSIATTAFVVASLTNYVRGYNSGGLVAGMKIWIGSATTDGSGDWSADFSAAGFGGAPTVLALPILNTATVTDMLWSSVTTVSATEATGTAIRGAVLAILGATLRRSAAGATVQVIAIGA